MRAPCPDRHLAFRTDGIGGIGGFDVDAVMIDVLMNDDEVDKREERNNSRVDGSGGDNTLEGLEGLGHGLDNDA
jgi:hypothetical protein